MQAPAQGVSSPPEVVFAHVDTLGHQYTYAHLPHARSCLHSCTSMNAPMHLLTGRIVIDLDTTKTPSTAYNFKCLCTGERGRPSDSASPSRTAERNPCARARSADRLAAELPQLCFLPRHRRCLTGLQHTLDSSVFGDVLFNIPLGWRYQF